MKKILVIIATLLFLGANTAQATDEPHHTHGKHKHPPHSDQAMSGNTSNMKEAFLKTRDIDGYNVSFHAMKAAGGMHHGDSSNFMIKVEQNGQALVHLLVNSKVVYPDGKSESKMMKRMGDWYMAGYDLNESGEHQLMVLFKTTDGKMHRGGVYYPARDGSTQENGNEAHH